MTKDRPAAGMTNDSTGIARSGGGVRAHGRRNRGGGGGPGGTFPSGSHKFQFLSGTRGDPILNENGPFLLLLGQFFSNCNSCIGGLGPLRHLQTLFLGGPQGLVPSTSELISPALSGPAQQAMLSEGSDPANPPEQTFELN